MKKLLVATALLLTFSLSADAQTLVTNNTDCSVDVTLICWDPHCPVPPGPLCCSVSETTITVSAHSSRTTGKCQSPLCETFYVKWTDPGCTGSVNVSYSGCCIGYNPTAILPACASNGCGQATVDASLLGKLDIN